MTDLVWTVEQPAIPPTASTDNLDRLVARVAAGDRLAFRLLYAFLAVRVWHTAARAMPHAWHAFAVVRSTFLEVSHTAGAAAHRDARDWIGAVTEVRLDERRRIVGYHAHQDLQDGIADLGQPLADLVGQDAHIHRQLARLLGPGRATIRVGPAMFLDIDDLDGALDAIVAAVGQRRRHSDRRHHQDRATEGPAGRAVQPATTPAPATTGELVATGSVTEHHSDQQG